MSSGITHPQGMHQQIKKKYQPALTCPAGHRACRHVGLGVRQENRFQLVVSHAIVMQNIFKITSACIDMSCWRRGLKTLLLSKAGWESPGTSMIAA